MMIEIGTCNSSKTAYFGKIIEINPIINADTILAATVVCGQGGKWQGVIKNGSLQVGDMCLVYLPDALLPECEALSFMKRHNWRVKICKFKGAPSEVLIIPLDSSVVLPFEDVKKYQKPVPANLAGKVIGKFPSFIPRTDEPNYQRLPGVFDKLADQNYIMTLKMDGSSTTAFVKHGILHVCSRNYDLEYDKDNGYWVIAEKYHLKDELPEGIALQWETCGPKIQSNPMGLKEIEGFAFNAYNFLEQRYLNYKELKDLCDDIRFPVVDLVSNDLIFHKTQDNIPSAENFQKVADEMTYQNGKPAEGIVVSNMKSGEERISFKVINRNYE